MDDYNPKPIYPRCRLCDMTDWTIESNRVTYFKIFPNGARLQESMCIHCSAILHLDRTVDGWSLDNELD